MNRNNEPDKHAVDALFARKLGNAVSSPNADGFARLQARMGQTKAEKKPGFVVWRNPNVQRFMAIAACLLLICMFGWFYLSSNTPEGLQGPQMATTESGSQAVPDVPSPTQDNVINAPTAERPDGSNPTVGNQPTQQVATVVPKSRKQDRISGTSDQQITNANLPAPRTELAQNTPTEQQQTEQNVPKKVVDQSSVSLSPDQIAAVKPIPATQRVLVVTIAEPERLVAARQAVKMEMMETTLAATITPEKVAKPGFWEQVRRVKEGEVFARSNGSDDEGGLLNRAYNGLKNSIDKDKTSRQ